MQCLTHSSQQLQARSACSRCSVPCHRSAPCRRVRTHNRHQRSVSTEASSQRTQEKTYPRPDMTIDNLDETYCNDFECTSSPAVEQTVRQLARDITRFKYNTNFFQPDVQFSDGFRSFKGSDKYRSAFWARQCLQNPRAQVTKLQMLNNSPNKAQIDWELSGRISSIDVTVPVKSVFELNLVTGRVTSHTESWDVSRLPAPAAAAVTGSRVIWSAKASAKQTSDSISSKVTESLQSLASMDDDEYYMNPNDPTKFFQKNDNQMNDAIMLALGVAGLYLVFKVFEQLETLN
eukprot:GHUV01002505.1.p1 GENE.GHUV01002505.1~~GHUV01002505.1.p1  ORF type:complete len:290 (+),score=54.25 GHUV01002505.1:90-959(+)